MIASPPLLKLPAALTAAMHEATAAPMTFKRSGSKCIRLTSKTARCRVEVVTYFNFSYALSNGVTTTGLTHADCELTASVRRYASAYDVAFSRALNTTAVSYSPVVSDLPLQQRAACEGLV